TRPDGALDVGSSERVHRSATGWESRGTRGVDTSRGGGTLWVNDRCRRSRDRSSRDWARCADSELIEDEGERSFGHGLGGSFTQPGAAVAEIARFSAELTPRKQSSSTRFKCNDYCIQIVDSLGA